MGPARDRRLAAWIFPVMVITEVVSSQPWWIGGIQPGQILGWVVIVLFGVMIFTTAYLGAWARGLFGLVVLAKLGSWFTGLAMLNVVYRVSLVGTGALVGAMLALEHAPYVRRQAAWLMIASAPLMLLQASGVGGWTQALTTHGLAEFGEGASKEGTPTLFVPTDDLIWQTVQNVQSRPAGFFHASEFASLMILFALVLAITARKQPHPLAIFAACAAGVLSMAKIVLLSGTVAILWVLLTGNSRTRRNASMAAAWLAVCLLAYRILFPGLFEANLGLQTFALSFLSRAYDVASVLGYGALADRQLYEAFGSELQLAHGESLSGIGQIVRFLPAFLVVSVIGLPLLVAAFRRMRGVSRQATHTASTLLLSAGLFLVAGPFLGSTIFWFCMGFGLFPLLTLVDPEYVRFALTRLGRTIRPVPAARRQRPSGSLHPGTATS